MVLPAHQNLKDLVERIEDDVKDPEILQSILCEHTARLVLHYRALGGDPQLSVFKSLEATESFRLQSFDHLAEFLKLDEQEQAHLKRSINKLANPININVATGRLLKKVHNAIPENWLGRGDELNQDLASALKLLLQGKPADDLDSLLPKILAIDARAYTKDHCATIKALSESNSGVKDRALVPLVSLLISGSKQCRCNFEIDMRGIVTREQRKVNIVIGEITSVQAKHQMESIYPFLKFICKHLRLELSLTSVSAYYNCSKRVLEHSLNSPNDGAGDHGDNDDNDEDDGDHEESSDDSDDDDDDDERNKAPRTFQGNGGCGKFAPNACGFKRKRVLQEKPNSKKN